MRRYFHSRLYRKMLVSVLLITLIPLGLVYFYINYVYSSRLRQDAVRINHFAEKSAALQAEEILVRMEYLSNLFFIEEVQQILKVSNDPLSINTAQQKLEKVIRVNMDLYNIMNKVDQVSFVRPDGSRFIVMNSAKDTAPLEFNNLERIAVNHYKNHVVMKADELSEQARDKMVYARRIVDMNTLEFMGYCIVIFDKEEFESIFSDLIQVMNTRVLVSDSSGEVLYSDFDEGQRTSHQMVWDYELDNFGLKLTFYDDISSINSNLRSLSSLTELVILGSVAVILAISVFFVRTIVHPVVCLHESLKNIREGDFHVRVSIEARNELGDVGTAFNDMAAEIDRLVNQVYSIQLKEKETAIAALQAQINPHFLYHTLDMIKSMAEIGGAYQVGEVIVALSGLFRYATSTSSFVVTIRDELENLKHYLLIVNARYNGMITCCVDAVSYTHLDQ